MEKEIFKQDAKVIVDMAFDSKLFNDKMTRDTMNVFEEHIAFILQSRFESYKRMDQLLSDLKEIKSC